MPIPVLQGMTGQGWVWIGSDGVLATPPSNATKAARAMQGSMGILPKGKCRDFFTLYNLNGNLMSHHIMLREGNLAD